MSDHPDERSQQDERAALAIKICEDRGVDWAKLRGTEWGDEAHALQRRINELEARATTPTPPDQREPVAWMAEDGRVCTAKSHDSDRIAQRIYTAPLYTHPQRDEGEVTVTTDEAGNCVAVTRTDDEHRILSVIWQAPQRDDHPDRLPAEIINALPEQVRSYIHWLEADADPAGTLGDNWRLTQENAALRKLLGQRDDHPPEGLPYGCWSELMRAVELFAAALRAGEKK